MTAKIARAAGATQSQPMEGVDERMESQRTSKHGASENSVGEADAKRFKISCLNFASRDKEDIRDEELVKDVFIRENPIFAIMDNTMHERSREMLRRQQHANMKYFIEVSGELITTNSAAVMAMLTTKGIMQEIWEDKDGFPTGKVTTGIEAKAVEEAVNRGMLLQIKADSMQMFICATTGCEVKEEDVEEANANANKCHESEQDFTNMEYAWDDVNNCELNVDKVKEARAAEMAYFRKMKVYKKVPIQRCKDVTGKMPIKVKWVDTNKQDETNPRYRSRLVAKGFKRYNDPDLYTGTPPIEVLRFLVSLAATGWSRKQRRRKLMVNDVARAYFNAPNLVPTFVEICEEDQEPGDEDICGELLVSMYGTRPAANNWQKFYTTLLINNGFERTRACTCTFRHHERDIDLMVHGDDFVSTGDGDDLVWLKGIFEAKFEISTNTIGHEPQDEKQLKVLNRIITVEEHGYTYEPDARHAEVIIRDLGLRDAKSVSTPTADDVREPDELLDHERYKKYQSICARCNFLALDRMDIQFASKECCRAMSKPTLKDWAKLKRIGRYLVGKPRLIYSYRFQDEVATLTAYSDANWASNAGDRKSTSGGVILHGSHYIKSWSKTQSLVALSSAEAELYGIVKTSSELLGLRSIVQDLGKSFGALVYSDASAALGVIQRQGLGRLRHVDCSFLFVQALNANKVVQYAKVVGQDNPADLGTKGLCAEGLLKHIGFVGGEFRAGRPALCPGAVRCVSRTNLSGGRSEGVHKVTLTAKTYAWDRA